MGRCRRRTMRVELRHSNGYRQPRAAVPSVAGHLLVMRKTMTSIDSFEPCTWRSQLRRRRRTMSKHAAFLLPALCVWLAPIKAWAACSLSAGSGPLIDNAVYLTVPAFSPGSLNLGVGVGGTIATMTASTTPTTGTFSCTTSYVLHHNGTTGVAVNKIYPTSIPGIGMQISYPGGYVVFPHIEPLA